MKQRFEFDSHLNDLHSITGIYGSEPMLQHMVENADFSKDKYYGHSVLKGC